MTFHFFVQLVIVTTLLIKFAMVSKKKILKISNLIINKNSFCQTYYQMKYFYELIYLQEDNKKENL